MEKKIPKSVLAVMFVSVLSVCQTVPANELAKKEQWEYASTTPDGKYPELVTYTLGKMTGANNSNLPKGETYENNAYTRYLREYFNIQNKDVFEEKNDQYNVSVSVAMSSDNLPDLMLVGSIEDLRQLVALDLIEDLTKSYENCLTDRIKDIYASYGEGIIDGVTFDGKIMAIPETNIDDGPNLLWLRRDWMDKLGLESPKTIEDAETIVQAFIERDPGENGEGKTVGFVCDPELSGECGYSSEYLMDIVFAANGAYPKQWIEDENGEVSYGSVLPQAKNSLRQNRILLLEISQENANHRNRNDNDRRRCRIFTVISPSNRIALLGRDGNSNNVCRCTNRCCAAADIGSHGKCPRQRSQIYALQRRQRLDDRNHRRCKRNIVNKCTCNCGYPENNRAHQHAVGAAQFTDQTGDFFQYARLLQSADYNKQTNKE